LHHSFGCPVQAVTTPVLAIALLLPSLFLPVFAACRPVLSYNGIALIGVIDWQRRRLVAGDDSGFGFGLSGFGEKCY
jgi:hypothetical protein